MVISEKFIKRTFILNIMTKSQGRLIGTTVGKTPKQEREAELFEAELHIALESIPIKLDNDVKPHKTNISDLESEIAEAFNKIFINETAINDIKQRIYAKLSSYLVNPTDYIISGNELDSFAVLAMYNADKQFPGTNYTSSRELCRFRVSSDMANFDRFLNSNQNYVIEELDENADIHVYRINFTKKDLSNVKLEEKNSLYCYINNGKLRIEEISKSNPFISFLHDYVDQNLQKLSLISDKENWNRQAIQCLDNALPTTNLGDSSCTKTTSLFYDVIFTDVK